MMQTYTYAALLEPGDEGGVVATFPDVPEAITQGADRAGAITEASDALGLALLVYAEEGRPMPERHAIASPMIAVTVEPDVAAKIAVLEAFRASGLSQSELGRRLGRDEKEVRRILDPMHATKLPTLRDALAALGRRLVVGVEIVAGEAA